MPQLSTTKALVAVLAICTIALLAYKSLIATRKLKSKHPLPPGPKPAPIIGNITDLPQADSKEWLHWLKLKEKYGPISSLSVLGQTIIVISDYKTAVELLEKRSAHTSSRPHLPFATMCGWDKGLALMPYSSKTRAYRKALHATLGTSTAVDGFQPLIQLETRRFLLKVLEQPQDVLQWIRREAGAIILRVGYNYTIEPFGPDPLVDIVDKAVAQLSRACAPGAWMVDVVPALQYLPGWLPGTGFKATARAWKRNVQIVGNRPFAFVEEQLRNGTAEPSYLSKLIGTGKQPLTPEADDVARWSAFALYTGGADTTVSSLACFVLAMTLHPEIQRQAQAEIDAAVGTFRLPTTEDRKNMPYIDAIVKEVLRWHPVAPMGVPHLATRDDTYEDYSIPANSILMPNIWAMLHDPAVYHDPSTFNPARFLGPHPEPDPHNISFGFGRRVCPGKLFADATLFSTIASFLAVFDVRKSIEDGKEVEPVVDFLPGLISHPAPFRCDIKARSHEREKIIRSVEVEHPWPEHGDARYLDVSVV